MREPYKCPWPEYTDDQLPPCDGQEDVIDGSVENYDFDWGAPV